MGLLYKSKELLGSIELGLMPEECVMENGKLIESRSYYVAHTNIQTLALLDGEYKGSNLLQCLTWNKKKRVGSSRKYGESKKL
jgi:hypothetical protein